MSEHDDFDAYVRDVWRPARIAAGLDPEHVTDRAVLERIAALVDDHEQGAAA